MPLLIIGVNETIENKTIELKGRFLSKLLGTLGASLFGNLLRGKEVMTTCIGTVIGDDGTNTGRQDF